MLLPMMEILSLGISTSNAYSAVCTDLGTGGIIITLIFFLLVLGSARTGFIFTRRREGTQPA